MNNWKTTVPNRHPPTTLTPDEKHEDLQIEVLLLGVKITQLNTEYLSNNNTQGYKTHTECSVIKWHYMESAAG